MGPPENAVPPIVSSPRDDGRPLPADATLVLHLELTLDLAPTLNVFARERVRMVARVKKAVDGLIIPALAKWPAWRNGFTEVPVIRKGKLRISRTGGRRRLVVVTRESAHEPDELTCDVLGGKIPIDRLVKAGVLRDDSRKWLERVGVWRPAPMRMGRVTIDVFDFPEGHERCLPG